MREHRAGERLHVVGQGVVAAVESCHGLRGAEEHQAGARGRAEIHARVGPRGVEDRHHVAAERLAAVHRSRRGLGGEHLGHLRNRLEVEHPVALGVVERACRVSCSVVG